MVVIPINEKIHNAVDAMAAGNVFVARSVIKMETSSRRVSSILKSRIRCPDNPAGDLLYEKGVWMKLEQPHA